jgi:hypothetical protein
MVCEKLIDAKLVDHSLGMPFQQAAEKLSLYTIPLVSG